MCWWNSLALHVIMYTFLAQDIHMMQGTKIFDESEDQDTTDLHKCVAYILQSMPNQEESDVGWIMM